jgi:hypothetical protein
MLSDEMMVPFIFAVGGLFVVPAALLGGAWFSAGLFALLSLMGWFVLYSAWKKGRR